MDILKKLQALSENTKKIVSWAIAIVVGIVFLFFWLQGFKKRLEMLKKEDIFESQNFPSFGKEIDDIKKAANEELTEIEELLQRAEQEIESENKQK